MSVAVQYSIGGKTASAIASSIEEGARSGRLLPDAPLPTVRKLAKDLHLSPTTVAAAYRLLKTRGVLRTDGRRGTRLAPRPPLATPGFPRVPRHLRNLADGNPDQALLPSWKRAIRTLPPRSRVYGGDGARAGLLHLARAEMESESIPAENLTVVGGAMDGLERVLEAHLKPADRVAVEDPGYVAVLDLLSALGLQAEPVRVDDFGMRPEGLAKALESGAACCVMTPRAQNPTGACFDKRRVRELKRVLEAHPKVLLIEDDHAGPVAGAEALTLVDARLERWAVLRSVSKSLGPDLRLAFLAGDGLTVARVEGRRALGAGWVSHVLQTIVEAVLRQRETPALLLEARRVYAERRERLLKALAQKGLKAHGRSGLNVWVPVAAEASVVAHLAADGWAVRPGERYRLRSPPAIRITVATLRGFEVETLAEDVLEAVSSGAGRGVVA